MTRAQTYCGCKNLYNRRTWTGPISIPRVFLLYGIMQLNVTKYLSISILTIPPLFLLVWFLARFPSPPTAVPVYPSLASLPPETRSWTVYPEDIFEGGSYVTFPYGKVRILFFLCYPTIDIDGAIDAVLDAWTRGR